MKRTTKDLFPRPTELPLFGSRPARPPIHMATVYECDSPESADARLGGKEPGYVYARDGHPNGVGLVEKFKKLHLADEAVVTSSGNSATAVGIVANLVAGDHVLLSNRLYGGTSVLVREHLGPLGIESSVVDFYDLEQVQKAARTATRMLIAETISNPMLRVVDIKAIADIAHEKDALLMIDNTFASPVVCQPLGLGADLVTESLTKIINGHSDVTMGVLCGTTMAMARADKVARAWGLTSSSPLDCWLADRGMATLELRMTTAAESAVRVANWLNGQLEGEGRVVEVCYPGLAQHADHEIAGRQFMNGSFANMVTFRLAGGLDAARRFISNASEIPFCPSLGDLNTTLSHPSSTSHRSLNDDELANLGVDGGTIRLSIGIESYSFIEAALVQALGN